MVWGAISWHGLGPIIAVKGTMKSEHYRNVLENQVFEHLKVKDQLFLHNYFNFKSGSPNDGFAFSQRKWNLPG